MASLATTDHLISEDPDIAAGAVRAIVKTHAILRKDLGLATQLGRKLFPAFEAELISELIQRDLPFYDALISREFVAGMNQFACDLGLLKRSLNYDQIVATQFSTLWHNTI
jgi:NitT/TauT family transport system substrate-binding protein